MEEEKQQFLSVEVALVELVMGMALHLPMDAVQLVLEFLSNLSPCSCNTNNPVFKSLQ